MRREDKRQLPPRLKLKLPLGYFLEHYPGGYSLYRHEPFGPGTMTSLVTQFKADTPAEVITAYALGAYHGHLLKNLQN